MAGNERGPGNKEIPFCPEYVCHLFLSINARLNGSTLAILDIQNSPILPSAAVPFISSNNPLHIRRELWR